MSDGPSQGYEAERNRKAVEDYLRAIEVYIRRPDNAGLFFAVDTGVKAGIKSRTEVREFLGRLREGDRLEWAKLFYRALNSARLKNLKEISPFADKMLIINRYGEQRVIGFDVSAPPMSSKVFVLPMPSSVEIFNIE
jgi:hypothetical protein